MRQELFARIPRKLLELWDGKTNVLKVMNRTYDYLVISHDLSPAPKYFAAFNPDACIVPFISDDVPIMYRQYMMTHEIYERMYLAGQPHHCLRALEFELGGVPSKTLQSYIPFRLKTYESLLGFLHDPIHGSGYPPDMIPLVTEAYDYLKRLLR